MVYPDTIEHKTGFDAVRRSIAALCSSPLGQTHCESMCFSTSFDTVSRLLKQTAEMADIIAGDAGLSLTGIHDKRQLLQTLRVPGTYAAQSELPGLRASLGAMAEIAAFFGKLRGDDPENPSSPYPELDALACTLSPYPVVTAAIDRIIDRHGDIKDNASEALADIRRSMAACAAGINSAMRRVIASAVREGYIEADVTPSVRDGRLVIPVAPMYKRKIAGIVHDESASGKTFFIEPAEVVEANNRLRELAIEEKREIVRILTALADTIRPEIDPLLDGFDILGTFDFIHAKARYAAAVGGMMPHLSQRPEIEWYGACHPVLKQSLERQGKTIVPLDIRLDDRHRLLIISGPNAGGKSVTLKTVAITQYMTQCGVLPVMHDNSHIGIMESIFIDIGDDQSIEDDLSTYSSHLRNMKYFLAHGDDRTLILIDEFGGGTEPGIGGAIAQALLKQFNKRHMWGVITTHYQNLKQFAEETPGLVNGSMLYDRQRMQPLFSLAIGHPGSSFAIEIARKTGLPQEIIDDAGEIVGSDYVNMDKYLLDIARDRRYWENKRQEIRRKEKQLEETLERYEAEMEALRGKRREIISEARDKAREILDGSNASIERTIREIRNSQADKERTREARRRLEEERRTLAAKAAEGEGSHPLLDRQVPARRKKKEAEPRRQPAAEAPLQPGDNVLLDGGDTVGTIADITGKNATVIFGAMKMTVKLSRLKRTIRKAQSGASKGVSYISSQTSDASRERQLAFSHEIDVRGMRADEAVQAVMYYIDDAIQFNASRVRILHGTGTGALRQYIRTYLDTVPAVKSYHDEDVRLGGAGITVIEF
ncbi:MAG: Smr/MutS family protein [Muribaculaceae bacterium]|nr:Smr/MutS family protein [Muribaculaceae bacterium]